MATGLEGVFLQHRAQLLRFLQGHGAGEAAEDLLQEVWLRARGAQSGPIAQPLSYLYRIANNLMLDRHRSLRQAAIRERDWSEATGATAPGRSDEPAGERVLIARETLARVRRSPRSARASSRSSAATASTGCRSGRSRTNWG